MLHNASICVGFVAIFGMGAILPDPDDEQGLKDDERWRIIYMAPAMIAVIEIFFILVVYRLETIGFCIMKGQEEEGKK